MNQSLQPPPGDEILTNDLLRKHGAQKGMKYWDPINKYWEHSVWLPGQTSPLFEQSIINFVHSAPLGTTAAATTPVPERECECDTYVGTKVGEHFTNCPAHPRNRRVHVLPGELARLKEKPDGLMWACQGSVSDWEPAPSEWPFSLWFGNYTGCTQTENFAYCVPLHVREEIDRELAERYSPFDEAPEYHDSIAGISTQTEKGGEPCATIMDSTWPDAAVTNAVASNAAPAGVPSSQAAAMVSLLQAWVTGGECFCADHTASRGPCDYCRTQELLSQLPVKAATEPTAEEAIKHLEDNWGAISHWPNGWFWSQSGPFPTLRAAITAAMKGEK